MSSPWLVVVSAFCLLMVTVVQGDDGVTVSDAATTPEWLNCLQCETGEDASGDICAYGDETGNFSAVPVVNCQDVYEEKYPEGEETDDIMNKCFKSYSSIYDTASKKDYVVVTRGCGFFVEKDGCSESPAAQGSSALCYCTEDECNGATKHTLCGAAIAAILLVAARVAL